MVSQGFTQEELEFNINSSDGTPQGGGSVWSKFPKLDQTQMHKIAPKIGMASAGCHDRCAYFFNFYTLSVLKLISIKFYVVINGKFYFIRPARTFNFPLDNNTLQVLSRKNFSDETSKKVRWVQNMFADWRFHCNFNFSDEVISCDLEYVSTISVDSFNYAMPRFITEVRKLDGSDFPAKTLYQIVICVQFYLETQGINWKLLDDKKFTEVKYTLDNVMKARTAAGIGITVNKSDVLSKTDEDILWSQGLLGTDTPEKLLNTVLFTLDLNCALRAGKEHRSLCSTPFQSQFSWCYDDRGVKFLRLWGGYWIENK